MANYTISYSQIISKNQVVINITKHESYGKNSNQSIIGHLFGISKKFNDKEIVVKMLKD